MWRLLGAIAALLIIAAGPASAKNVSDFPEPQNSVAPKLGPNDYSITSIELLSINPDKPAAGQLAQIRFRFRTSGEPPPNNVVQEVLGTRFSIVIDGRRADVARSGFSVGSVGEANSPLDLFGTATFEWPAAPSALRSKTRTSSVEVQADNGKLRSDRRLVEVAVEGQESLLWLALATIAVVMLATAGAFTWARFIRPEILSKRRSRGGFESVNIAVQPSAEPAVIQPPVEPAASEGEPPRADPPVPQPEASIPSPEIPADLVRAIADGQGVLALGAGASATAGLPTGSALLMQTIEHFRPALPHLLSRVLDSADPSGELGRLLERIGGASKVMDVITAAAPRQDLISFIAQALETSSSGGPVLGSLAGCPWRSVISLGWDNLAERAFTGHAAPGLPPMRAVTIHDTLELPSSTRAGERLLYKPFGDLGRPTTLALTGEEMRRLVQRAPAFQRSLAGLFQSQTFLFAGADPGAIEQFLLAITPEFESANTRHYALVPSDPTNALRQASLARFGVHLLEFDASASTSALSDLARQLRNEVRDLTAARAPLEAGSLTYLSGDRITHVHLESIGPFERLDLEFANDPEQKGEAPWSVIFGSNGVGKSSILRAIALVMAGDHPAALAAGTRLLRAGAAEGLIEVQVGSQTLKTRLTRDLSRVVINSLQQTPLGSGNALVLGFPALRGVRTPDPAGPSSQPDGRDPDPADLVALIGGELDPRLADFKQWLVNILSLSKQGDPRAQMMRDLFNGIIADIVPGQIEALAPLADGDFVIRVVTPEGLIPFDDLSQGMASIFNWVGLLAQRLFSICLNSSDPSREPAIVLIDEVDAHLHPEWQRRLVTLTRRYFPNVQVIATSHSPLLAGALRAHELVVLERDPVSKTVSQLAQVADPFGLPSQDILTSSVFGMTTDRNPQVETLISDYFEIFQKPRRTKAEEEKLRRLDAELQQFRYGGTETATAPALPSLSPEEIERINQRIGPIQEGSAP